MSGGREMVRGEGAVWRGAEGLLHEVFDRAVERWPERVALEVPPGRGRAARECLTYRELNDRAEAIAGRLRDRVRGEGLVGILLRRDTWRLYGAQLAALRAGAAYVCMDPGHPDERLRELLADAEAVAVVTDAEGGARLRRLGMAEERIVVVALEGLGASRGDDGGLSRVGKRPPWLTPRHLAYVIYTSGTTGRPKGVMIEHRSVTNLVAADVEEFGLGPEDRVAQGSSPAYDSSVEEIWLAWSVGATLVVMDEEAVRSGPDVVSWLARERVSVFCPPPTLLRATGCRDPGRALPGLRLLYVGGEVLLKDDVAGWGPGRRLVNGYGPTECTVTCVRGEVRVGEAVTIGRPVRGMRAWVLDEAMEEVTDGAAGELWVGGVGLARGYWRSPELTASKFVDHPRWGRVYRTGDRVRWRTDGRLEFQGREDGQVKVRGHRIELAEVEAHVARCRGVRAVACRVEESRGRSWLEAFVVPEDPACRPAVEEMRRQLMGVLPEHMVPGRFGYVEALPTTVGGKLNRGALPRLGGGEGVTDEGGDVLEDEWERRLSLAVGEVLGVRGPLGRRADFFLDLGGDSLTAAQLVTRLREDPASAGVTVRDVYEARTVEGLARRLRSSGGKKVGSSGSVGERGRGRLVWATLAQGVWLSILLVVVGAVCVLAGHGWVPQAMRDWGLVNSVLAAPACVVLGLAGYVGLSVAVVVAVKWLAVGRYRAVRMPVWSAEYVRHWVVEQTARMVPWKLLEGTEFRLMVLRWLGARIGRRVHLHRGVDLARGGWDLLEVGDDVTVGQDAAIRLVALDGHELVVGPVTLRAGAVLETRAGVEGHTVLEEDACLAALSSLEAGGRIPRGERWDGIPARRAEVRARGEAVVEEEWSPLVTGMWMTLGRATLWIISVWPIQLLALLAIGGIGGAPEDWWRELGDRGWWGRAWLAGAGLFGLGIPLSLAWRAVLLRALGRVREGEISRWSLAYVRVWLKSGMVEGVGHWLSGTLFWPVWLRAAGMRVGRGCEVSTVIDVVPELVEIGAGSFLADGVYLGGPRVVRGRVWLGRTGLGANTFLGNHAVVRAGQRLPEDILLGVCTLVESGRVRAGSSWFGHPPFELPRREVVVMDRRWTHQPSWVRFGNRVFWEGLRFALPAAPLGAVLGWYWALSQVAETAAPAALLLGYGPLAALGAIGVLVSYVLGLKWVLLGRVRPGQHPLWSCWCSRWDFLYVAWGQHARRFLRYLEGTLWLSWYLRAMGMSIGRGVVLGRGFAQVVDPDMIEIEDHASVDALFQAHTFEDRVLKLDKVRIRRGACVGTGVVMLYGAEVGEGARVAPHSVVMKGERLLPGLSYESVPTQLRSAE